MPPIQLRKGEKGQSFFFFLDFYLHFSAFTEKVRSGLIARTDFFDSLTPPAGFSGGGESYFGILDQFRMASSVSGSNRCSFFVLIATLTSLPFFAVLVGLTRAVILYSLYSRYR